jgi:hypothetical protein
VWHDNVDGGDMVGSSRTGHDRVIVGERIKMLLRAVRVQRDARGGVGLVCAMLSWSGLIRT